MSYIICVTNELCARLLHIYIDDVHVTMTYSYFK